MVGNGVNSETIIPDEDRLFRRIPLNTYRQLMKSMHEYYNQLIPPNLFALRENQEGLSVEWEKYATPEETQARFGNPKNFGVFSMETGQVRKIKPLKVKWTPNDITLAHSEITGIPNFGELKTTIRQELSRISKMIIPLD